jgi:hypothetical protein
MIDEGDELTSAANSDPSTRARPLFVGGCQRSGTTAFADYMNRHPSVLIGVERYGRIPSREITPRLFTFERFLDFREETVRPRDYYAALLSEKNERDLEWVGDKNPNYVLRLNLLSRNNPGARFIVLYRPVEEVAESWGVGARNPEDPWRGRENGFERGVQAWNRALSKTREFVVHGAGRPVLIVDYHDFFYRNEACASLISRFLDLEFDEEVLASWKAMSARFERERRPKSPLTEGQVDFVRTHKDRAAEDWILRRIEEQWRSLEKDPEDADALHGPVAAEKSPVLRYEIKEDKGLKRRTEELERGLAEKTHEAQLLRRENERLKLQVLNLHGQLRDIHNSRIWKVLCGLGRLRTGLLGRERRTS